MLLHHIDGACLNNNKENGGWGSRGGGRGAGWGVREVRKAFHADLLLLFSNGSEFSPGSE